MAYVSVGKQEAEEADVRAALAAIGIVQPDLFRGADPPDFVLRVQGLHIPIEHTRLYLDDSASSPQARAKLWLRLKEAVRKAASPIEFELEFHMARGWPNVPRSAEHGAFTDALVSLGKGRPAPFALSGLELPPELSPYLSRVDGRRSLLKGEIFGTPDASYLDVPSFDSISACVLRKSERLKGVVSGAWLVIVLGADTFQPFLGVGELEPELSSISLAGSPFERVYVIDVSFRHGYVLQDGTWRRAV